MIRSRFIFAAIVAATTVPTVAFADDHSTSLRRADGCEGMTDLQAPNRSVQSDYRVASVAPYIHEWTPIKTTFKEVRGAVVRVEPQPGLTAEWLQLRLGRRLAMLQMSPLPADYSPLAVPGVRATVSSAPDGFLVTLAASDKGTGEEVLRRAQSLVAQR